MVRLRGSDLFGQGQDEQVGFQAVPPEDLTNCPLLVRDRPEACHSASDSEHLARLGKCALHADLRPLHPSQGLPTDLLTPRGIPNELLGNFHQKGMRNALTYEPIPNGE